VGLDDLSVGTTAQRVLLLWFLIGGPTSDTLQALCALNRRLAAQQARELGLLDPDGPGSWTHPDLSRMLHADGKVITPLFRARVGCLNPIRPVSSTLASRWRP
jgi:hypothetical protein